MHKSNSTYFSDLDISRSQLFICLLRHGIRNAYASEPRPDVERVTAGLAKTGEVTTTRTMLGMPRFRKDRPPSTATRRAGTASDRLSVALGGVSCTFKQELKPGVKFDMWTRVLSWDRKWVYLVSHIVKAGVVQPDGYALQPWKSQGYSFLSRWFGGERKTNVVGSCNRVLKELEEEQSEEWKNAIFATSISKYVVKKGRLTISPERVWENAGLLPPKPGKEGDEGAADDDSHAWTWSNVERERQRAWDLAQHFAALDGAMDEFPVCWPSRDREITVLGDYLDLASF